MPRKKHILFCVLNWGLGHATRSLPVMEYLLEKGHQLTIASDGLALEFLRSENLDAGIETLNGYDVNYAETRPFRAMIKQGPRIFSAVRKEHRRVQEIVRRKEIDAVISDSRFGCFHDDLPSCLIGHTLQIRTKDPITSWAFNMMIRKWASRFDRCWVPDLPPPDHLSGFLSEAGLGIPKDYLGWLTNLRKKEMEMVYDLVAVLSGPEPARTQLERVVLDQLDRMEGRFLVIGGSPGKEKGPGLAAHIRYVPIASRLALSEYAAQAPVILGRSGYSSIMDWLLLEKKMIVIPTPGQLEQEYLADVLKEKNWAVSRVQGALDIRDAMKETERLSPPVFPGATASRFRPVVDQLIGA